MADLPPARYLHGDVVPCLRRLATGSVDAALTSIPYWGRARYLDGDTRELGTQDLHRYIDAIADVFDEVARVLTRDALCWVNIGDTSVGSGGAGGDHREGHGRAAKAKYRQAAATVWHLDRGTFGGSTLATLPAGSWAGVPHRVAAELQLRGWLLRSSIVWAKPNPKREDIGHVRRPKEQHETVLMLSRVPAGETRFASDDQRLGDVWELPEARGLEKAGKAPWPVALPARMLELSGPPGLAVDPFAGAGNTAIAARKMGWDFVGIDLDPDAVRLAAARTPIEVTVVDSAAA